MELENEEIREQAKKNAEQEKKYSKLEVIELFYRLRHMFFNGVTYTNEVGISQFQNELRQLISNEKDWRD